MSNDELNKVELPALEQLKSLGWIYVEGEKLSPDESDERSSFKDVILEKRLKKSIKKINPWINEDNLRKVISDLTRSQFTNLIEANQSIWNTLTQYTSVMQDLGKGNRGQTVLTSTRTAIVQNADSGPDTLSIRTWPNSCTLIWQSTALLGSYYNEFVS